jgi:hypothetical protein
LEVSVGEAESVLLAADVTRRGSWAGRTLTMLFAPWRCLSIEVAQASTPTRQSSRQGRVWPYTGVLAGAVVLLLGLDLHSTPLAALGGAVAVIFEVVALRQAFAWRHSSRRG